MDACRKRSALRAGVISMPKRMKSSPQADPLAILQNRNASHQDATQTSHSISHLSLFSPLPHQQPWRSLIVPAAETPADVERDYVDQLPDAIVLKIFRSVPPREVARKCAMISTAWARFARSEELWKGFCVPWGLTKKDASQVLGGWRGLYATVFGSDLVQCPNFERIHHSESPGDKDCFYNSGPFRPSSKLVIERITSLGEVEAEYSARSHWGADADADAVQGIFMRGGVNSLYRTQVSGLYQTPVPPFPHHNPEACSCSQHPSDATMQEERVSTGHPALLDHESVSNYGPGDTKLPEAGSDTVCTADCQWGSLKQTVSLRNFTSEFLDSRAPIQLSAWCASKTEQIEGVQAEGLFRMQLVMLGEDKTPLYRWDSTSIASNDNKWRNLCVSIRDYPQGARSLVVKVAGKGVHFTQVKACFCSNS